MSRDRMNKLLPWIGAGSALLGGFWALALVAANLVLGPHVARAQEKVKIMCGWAQMADDYAEVQNANTAAICEVIGAKCLAMPPRPKNPLLEGCEKL